MQEFTSHKPGTFCWIELATTDPENAKKFYNELFGWDFYDIPIGENNFYTLCKLNGKDVAALYGMFPEQLAMNLPPNWLPYVASNDVFYLIKQVKENNGKVSIEPCDKMEEGIPTVIQDPEGAYLGVWQAKNHIGSSYKNIHGAITWMEHASRNSDAAIKFYGKIFNWTSKTEQMGEGQYTTFFINDEVCAGLYIMPPQLDGVPSHWLPYFFTSNIDKSLEITNKHNGEILMPKMFIQGVGYFAVIKDVQGAALGLVQGEEM